MEAFLPRMLDDTEVEDAGPVCLNEEDNEGRCRAWFVGVSLLLLFSSISSSESTNRLPRSSLEAAARPYFLSERVLALTCCSGKVCLVARNDVAAAVAAGDIELDDDADDDDAAADLL